MTILQDIYQLKPNNLVTLYELDLSPCIGRYGATTSDIYRWCDGVNELGNDIEWNGNTYTRYPIQTSGFDRQGNGTIPRPKLIAGNYGGIIGDLAREYNDIIGARLTRTRTFAKYLDSSNFPAKNSFVKSNDLTHSKWIKDNITVTQNSNIVPFAVGSKVNINGIIPSGYNFNNVVVVSSTPNSITISTTTTGSQIQAGTISGSGLTVATVSIDANGSSATIYFSPIASSSVVPNEPIFAITEVSNNGTHSIYSNNYSTYIAGSTYCKSVYIRPGLRSKLIIKFPGDMFATGVDRFAYIDLLNKSYFMPNTVKGNVIIEPLSYANGWFRVSASDTAEVSVSTYDTDFILYHNSEVYVGNNSQPAVLVSAPQISKGSLFPVEYHQEANTTIVTNPHADPNQYLDKEIWTIDRKANENSAFVEWELTAPYDLIGVKIPRRQCIQNVCSWKYRSAECGYTGNVYFNIKDEQVGSPSQDICGKRVTSCKLRFPNGQALPYGGFPSIGIY